MDALTEAMSDDAFDIYRPVRTIDEALERLAKFIPRGDGWTGIHQVASGGVMLRPDQLPPALCATREMAVELWYQSVKRVLINTHAKTWYLPRDPTLDRWPITMTTARGDHRTAADRFCVIAHIGVTW